MDRGLAWLCWRCPGLRLHSVQSIHRFINGGESFDTLKKNCVLDSSEGMHGFKALGEFIVFFSYQWLSWDEAGPDTIQINAMTESLKIIAASLQLDIQGMYI